MDNVATTAELLHSLAIVQSLSRIIWKLSLKKKELGGIKIIIVQKIPNEIDGNLLLRNGVQK